MNRTSGGGDIDEREGGGDMDGRAEMVARGAGGGGGGCLLYGSQFVFLRGTLISLSTSSPKIRNTDIPRVSIPGILHLGHASIFGLCCLFFQLCNCTTSVMGQM